MVKKFSDEFRKVLATATACQHNGIKLGARFFSDRNIALANLPVDAAQALMVHLVSRGFSESRARAKANQFANAINSYGHDFPTAELPRLVRVKNVWDRRRDLLKSFPWALRKEAFRFVKQFYKGATARWERLNTLFNIGVALRSGGIEVSSLSDILVPENIETAIRGIDPIDQPSGRRTAAFTMLSKIADEFLNEDAALYIESLRDLEEIEPHPSTMSLDLVGKLSVYHHPDAFPEILSKTKASCESLGHGPFTNGLLIRAQIAFLINISTLGLDRLEGVDDYRFRMIPEEEIGVCIVDADGNRVDRFWPDGLRRFVERYYHLLAAGLDRPTDLIFVTPDGAPRYWRTVIANAFRLLPTEFGIDLPTRSLWLIGVVDLLWSGESVDVICAKAGLKSAEDFKRYYALLIEDIIRLKADGPRSRIGEI